MVCKKLDSFCQQLLNKGFSNVDKFHEEIQREVKRQLPRRESERRSHPLARHVDILAAIETRISLLCMTYNKYISAALCCFIPGKVLDEMYRVLRYIRNETNVPRSHETLQELRDISSMAMEHFDEKIAPCLKGRLSQMSSVTSFSCAAGISKNTVVAHEPMTGTRVPTSDLASYRTLRKSVLECRTRLNLQSQKMSDLNAKVTEQNKKLAEQIQIIQEQSRKIAEQDKEITELSRKVVDYDQKFVDIMSEISCVRNVRTASEGSSACEKNQDIINTEPVTHCLVGKSANTSVKRHAEDAVEAEVTKKLKSF